MNKLFGLSFLMVVLAVPAVVCAADNNAANEAAEVLSSVAATYGQALTSCYDVEREMEEFFATPPPKFKRREEGMFDDNGAIVIRVEADNAVIVAGLAYAVKGLSFVGRLIDTKEGLGVAKLGVKEGVKNTPCSSVEAQAYLLEKTILLGRANHAVGIGLEAQKALVAQGKNRVDVEKAVPYFNYAIKQCFEPRDYSYVQPGSGRATSKKERATPEAQRAIDRALDQCLVAATSQQYVDACENELGSVNILAKDPTFVARVKELCPFGAEKVIQRAGEPAQLRLKGSYWQMKQYSPTDYARSLDFMSRHYNRYNSEKNDDWLDFLDCVQCHSVQKPAQEQEGK